MKSRLLRVVCAALFVNAGSAYGISFKDLGELPNVHPRISRDGSVVFTPRTRWTNPGGWETWDSYTGGAVTDGVRAVSSNGSIVAGNSGNAAYHWSASTGVTTIGGWPRLYSFVAMDVSADGRIVVGTSTDPTSDSQFPTKAFKWTASDMVGLGPETEANAITADGSIIAGVALAPQRGLPPRAAFVWTAGSNWTTVPSPPPTGDSADGIAKANKGTLLVNANQSRYSPPQLWSPANGYSDLGDSLVESHSSNIAWAISSDGSIVVGSESATCPEPRCHEAWVWDAENERRSIRAMLIAEGIDLSDWQYLSGAYSVSADGSLIVGSGVNIDGKIHGWILNTDPSH